ncbi:MAG TPA: urease accessory protein [Woeseiaceae bacterium]|nr:urease accessory protein [Woeseiaceae bacterium]
MEYYTLLFFGCLIGMQHALEADHLAAVAALSAKQMSRRALVLRGSVWGLGHTVTLLTICGTLLFFKAHISAHTEAILELCVGVMIVLLGANVLHRLWRQRPHVHVHRHDRNPPHVHFHTHPDDPASHLHSAHAHAHSHHSLGLRRALVVGMVHGAAGSAGLMVLAAAARSVVEAAGYVLAFGAGSIIGMAALSFAASFPLRLMERCANWLSTSAFACIGCVAVGVGIDLIRTSWNVL